MQKRTALSALAILACAVATSAQADNGSGFYVGASVGQAAIEIDESDGLGFDSSDTAFKIFGGYAFSKNFGVELAYLDAGAPSERLDTIFGAGTVEVKATAFNASAVGRLPLGDKFSLFGKIGFTSYDAEVTARIDDEFNDAFNLSEDESDEEFSYGIGAAFSLGQSFELRAEYEAVNVSDGAFDVLSVGGLFRF